MKTPTIEEAKQYAKQAGLNIDVEYWWWKNKERGWVVMTKKGPIPMKSWKGNMQTWVRENKKNKKSTGKANGESFLQKYNRHKQDNNSGC